MDAATRILLTLDRYLSGPAEERNLGPALESTNADLEHLGLYISHIWGPEQEILTPEWRENCREVSLSSARYLRLLALGPLDLIVSKLCRADALDLADIRHVIEHCDLSGEEVRAAMRRASVLPHLAPGYPDACRAVEDLLVALGRGTATDG